MSEGGGQRPIRPIKAPPPAAGADGLRPTDVIAAFFVCAGLFLVAAAIAGVWQAIEPWPRGRWLALHLAFVGGVSQLVLGASQFFAAAFLATDPPPRGLVRAQLILWNAGAALLAVAVPTGSDPLLVLAFAVLIAGLAAWGRALVAIRRGALRRFSWATRWYVAGACFFAVGLTIGALLAEGRLLGGAGNPLAAHMALNLLGWFGGAIVGTLHTFYPSLTGTQLGFPRLQALTFSGWMGGVAYLAIGYGAGLDPVSTCGWLGLAVASALLFVNVVDCLRRATLTLSLPARLLGAAQLFLVAGMAAALAGCLVDGPDRALSGDMRDVAGTLLVTGWIGLTVLGSMLHLLAVVIRVRAGFFAPMPAPRPAIDSALTLLALVGIGGLALAQALGAEAGATATAALAVAAYLLIGGKTAVRTARVAIGTRTKA